MALDIFSTMTLLMAIDNIQGAKSFLRDRYFPTGAGDLFSSEKVLVEVRNGSKRLAPFVAPRRRGVTILRDGYTINEYTPPRIAPERLLTIDDLQTRGFGEALFSQLTPEDRVGVIVLQDARELADRITRREEQMAAEVLIKNGLVMRHHLDKENAYDEMEMWFYDGNDNKAWYTPSVNWNDPTADIIADLEIMVRQLTSRGLPASDLVVSPDVGRLILNNEKIQKLLDLNNYNIGFIDPAELTDGVVQIARLNVNGRLLAVLSYDEMYEDDKGEMKQFIPAGHIVLTAPAAGRTLYGAVTQMEQEDQMFHTYTGARVPKVLANPVGDTRTLTLTSRPLLVPNNVNPWISSNVLEGEQ